jgi:hypothetical protein
MYTWAPFIHGVGFSHKPPLPHRISGHHLPNFFTFNYF